MMIKRCQVTVKGSVCIISEDNKRVSKQQAARRTSPFTAYKQAAAIKANSNIFVFFPVSLLFQLYLWESNFELCSDSTLASSNTFFATCTVTVTWAGEDVQRDCTSTPAQATVTISSLWCDGQIHKALTLPRNQTFGTLHGHDSCPHCHDTVLRYVVTLQVCTHPYTWALDTHILLRLQGSSYIWTLLVSCYWCYSLLVTYEL